MTTTQSDPSMGGLPVGAVIDYAGATAPAGWLLCYGQAISRTVYAALFVAISTVHGVGDGSTTFNVPDYRGRVLAGKDDMGGSAANRITNAAVSVAGTTLGAVGGSQTHTLTAAQIPALTSDTVGNHTHSDYYQTTSAQALSFSTFNVYPDGDGTITDAVRTLSITSGSESGASTTSGAGGSHSHAVNGSGGGNAHANVQPTAITNKIIFAGV